MPIPLPPPQDPPAIVVSVETDSELSALTNQQSSLSDLTTPDRKNFVAQERSVATGSLNSQRSDQVVENSAVRESAPLVSNRNPDQHLSVVYINGIETDAYEARQAMALVSNSMGVEKKDISLLHNPEESNVAVGLLKVCGGMLSSRLNNRSEPECSGALERRIKIALENRDERLVIATHSRGSQIAESVLDAVYDEYQKTARGRHLWRQNAEDIEVIMYAPLVRSLPPGIRGYGLSNTLDLPARGAGRVARGMSALKNLTGWREHDVIQHIKYSPPENRLPDLVFNPESVHSSFDLIFDDAFFNIQLLGQDPATGTFSPRLLADNLARNIKEGRRSDILHLEIISQAGDQYGSKFSHAFKDHVDIDQTSGVGRIGEFAISSARMDRLFRR
jgi:hypothetical protein